MRTRTANVAVAKFAPFSPAVAAFALFLVWVAVKGGYFPGLWYPSAIIAVSLLLATVLVSGRVLPQQPAARVAVLAFAGLVVFNYLSITWAGSRGAALDASNKLLLYLALAWSLSLLPWTPRTLAVALCAWSGAIAIFCLVGLIHALGAPHLDPFFDQLRYATPLDYPNATAALAVMGMWPAVLLSNSRELPEWVRVCLLAVAVFLAEFSLLPQSRGALLALAATTPLAVVFAADRLRLLARIAIVGGGLALTLRPTIHVDDTINAGGIVGPVLQHAADVLFITTAAALVLGALLILGESRLRQARIPLVRPPGRLGRRGWITVGAIAVVALGAAVPGVIHLANVVSREGRTDVSVPGDRLLSVSPEERVDIARVAWKLFKSAPIAGVGAGNFGPRYDALRGFPKHSKYAHDIALRTLSETGLIGFLLFLVTVVALAAGILRRSFTTTELGRACLTAALLVAAYFLVHDSLDWLDEFPALATPALVFPLAAVGIANANPRQRNESRGRAWVAATGFVSRPAARLAATAALVLVGVALVLLALGAPYLSQQYVDRAIQTYKVQPAAAYADLSHASSLNPWSTTPLFTEGQIVEGSGDSSRARSAFERSLGIEDDWYAWLEIAVIDAYRGRFGLAASELSNAAKLDVDDPIISQARTMIQRRQRIDPVHFNLLFTQGVNAPLFSPQNIK
ncbi:MAG TPA: O-antigen ligase family protein [Solirubrobacteraceae bacterium]